MNSLKQLYKDIKTSWGKKFRWITAFFLLWIYRTIFMPAGDGGFAQALQIISLFSMLFIVYSHWQRKVVGIFRISNPPIRTLLLLYFYALLSATWAFMAAKHAKNIWRCGKEFGISHYGNGLFQCYRWKIQCRMAYLHSFAANGYLFCHVFCLLLCRMDKGKKRQAWGFSERSCW